MTTKMALSRVHTSTKALRTHSACQNNWKRVFSNWENSLGHPLKSEQQLKSRRSLECELQSWRHMMLKHCSISKHAKVTIGWMVTYTFVEYNSWLTWSVSFAVPCLPFCVFKILCALNENNLFLVSMLLPHFLCGMDLVKVDRTNSKLGKWDYPRSTWM